MTADYFLTNPAMINGKSFNAGDKIATLIVPDGVEIDRAIRAISTGLATQNAPTPAAPPATIAPAVPAVLVTPATP